MAPRQDGRRRGRAKAVAAEVPAVPLDPALEARRAISRFNREALAGAREGEAGIRRDYVSASLIIEGMRPEGRCFLVFEHCVAVRDGVATGHVAEHVRFGHALGDELLAWSDNAPWLAGRNAATFRGRHALADLFSDSPGTQAEGFAIVKGVFEILANEARFMVEAAAGRGDAIAGVLAAVGSQEPATVDPTARTDGRYGEFTVVSDLDIRRDDARRRAASTH